MCKSTLRLFRALRLELNFGAANQNAQKSNREQTKVKHKWKVILKFRSQTKPVCEASSNLTSLNFQAKSPLSAF